MSTMQFRWQGEAEGITATVSVEEPSLAEALAAFQRFLLAAGYVFDGDVTTSGPPNLEDL